jgi:glucose-1-phosphate thymidylyltransferase
MKGVLLAGGTGTRLYPITHTGPKQLVPVANKPILEYAIEDFKEAGITEIGVVLGHKGRDAIQEYLGDGSGFDVDITYLVQGDPLGLAHAVGCAKDFVGNSPFVVYLGDDLMREGIGDMVSDFNSEEYAAGIGLQAVDEPSRYGVVDRNQSGDITELIEKPDDPPSNLALIGIYIFTPAIFDRIERLEPSWRGELEITDAIQGLLDDGHQVQSHAVSGWRKDTGKPGEILRANRLVFGSINHDIAGPSRMKNP